MRFEVPQFIDVEAKVVGPLTWKQFIYVAGGVGFLLTLYLTTPFFIFLMLGLPVGILAGSLAFHRVHNRPFSVFVEALVQYMIKNKLYLWRRSEKQTIIERDVISAPTAQAIAYTHTKTINSLSHNLETQGIQNE